MAIRVKADNLGYGMLLSGIESREDAFELHRFFKDNGLDPVASTHGSSGYAILLHGLSPEALEHLIGGADIELA